MRTDRTKSTATSPCQSTLTGIKKSFLDFTTTIFSWNSFANVLWIDQPVNTGFSYSDDGDIGVVTEDAMASNMVEFFRVFFQRYPKYAKLPFYITGESYAGHVSHYPRPALLYIGGGVWGSTCRRSRPGLRASST